MIHTLIQKIGGGQAAGSSIQETCGLIVTEAQHEGHSPSRQQLCSAWRQTSWREIGPRNGYIISSALKHSMRAIARADNSSPAPEDRQAVTKLDPGVNGRAEFCERDVISHKQFDGKLDQWMTG